MRLCDLLIIGGGPSGLAAAISSKEEGIDNILIIEREARLGGILNQCIHDGFGLEIFKKSLTGPEYAKIFIDKINHYNIPFLLNTMVISLKKNKEVIFTNRSGIHRLKPKAIVLAMGAREKTRWNIGIPGTRPSGIFTAGVAQNLINLQNQRIGKNIVIIGSGDIGLIMARRLTLEGEKVHGVIEILPYPSGLPRNVIQCLHDFNIPLYLSHKVIEIKGEKRIDSVIIAKVGPKGGIIKSSKKEIRCDTLILSVGLIPENELSREAGIHIDEVTEGPIVDEDYQTSIPGIFACGNVLQIHDIVDYATKEAIMVGKAVASYIKRRRKEVKFINTRCGKGIKQVLPHLVSTKKDVVLSLRVSFPGREKFLLVHDKKRVIKEIPFHWVNPSEMIRIDLKAEEMKEVEELEVSLK
jgi:NADPH-dependent 2,4-dienoyl-CoA reductase/sulfur reductase-like enzyme